CTVDIGTAPYPTRRSSDLCNVPGTLVPTQVKKRLGVGREPSGARLERKLSHRVGTPATGHVRHEDEPVRRVDLDAVRPVGRIPPDRKSTRPNSSPVKTSYA